MRFQPGGKCQALIQGDLIPVTEKFLNFVDKFLNILSGSRLLKGGNQKFFEGGVLKFLWENLEEVIYIFFLITLLN